MSHHFDSPTALEDGRINLCDVFAFPGDGATSNLILTVNPDAGRSSPTTLRPDALYEVAIASDGGTLEDRAYRLTVGEPAADGRQRVTVRYAEGPQSHSGVEGSILGEGSTGEVIALSNGGSAWVGLALDPFWGDGVALSVFEQGLAEGRYQPELLSGPTPDNIFAGRNVIAIALQVPNASFGGDDVALWGRISLYGHAPQRQVSRMGGPMLRPLFFTPGPDTEALNAGSPADDVRLHGDRLLEAAAKLALQRGGVDAAEHAATVASAFLPDVLRFRPGQPARYEPGSGNGRGLHDDAFGAAVSAFNGSSLGRSASPHPVVADFPHLAAAGDDDLVPLLELFGIRPARGNAA